MTCLRGKLAENMQTTVKNDDNNKILRKTICLVNSQNVRFLHDNANAA